MAPLQPPAGEDHVCNPLLPGGVFQVARAVAAAQQVQLQHGNTLPGQGARLHGGHAAGLVHLLCERVDVGHQGRGHACLRRVVNGKAVPQGAGVDLEEQCFEVGVRQLGFRLGVRIAAKLPRQAESRSAT